MAMPPQFVKKAAAKKSAKGKGKPMAAPPFGGPAKGAGKDMGKPGPSNMKNMPRGFPKKASAKGK